MDITIEEFQVKDILVKRKKCLILGSSGSGKSTFIKNIINSNEMYSVVITNLKHIKSFYSFIDPIRRYRRYSSLLNERCFQNNMYLVLDDYFYNKVIYDEIICNCDKKDILCLITSTKFIDISVDLVFIFKNTEERCIVDVYNKYLTNYIDYENFKFILKSLDDYEPLGIKCNEVSGIDDLFVIFDFTNECS